MLRFRITDMMMYCLVFTAAIFLWGTILLDFWADTITTKM